MKKIIAVSLAIFACTSQLSAYLQQGLAAAPGNNFGFEDRRNDSCNNNNNGNCGSRDYYALPRSAYYDQPYYENRGDWRRDWQRGNQVDSQYNRNPSTRR